MPRDITIDLQIVTTSAGLVMMMPLRLLDGDETLPDVVVRGDHLTMGERFEATLPLHLAEGLARQNDVRIVLVDDVRDPMETRLRVTRHA